VKVAGDKDQQPLRLSWAFFFVNPIPLPTLSATQPPIYPPPTHLACAKSDTTKAKCKC